jgi:hypothetical protein
MDTNHNHEFIRIAVLDNEIEAQLVASILSEQNIPHWIQSFHDTAYDGLFQLQKGWGEVRSSLSYEQEILDLLDNLRTSDGK